MVETPMNYRHIRPPLFKLPTFKSRRSMMSTPLILGLMRGGVDSEFPLSRLKFNVPVLPKQNFELPSLNYYRLNYENNDLVRRACNEPLMNATE